ncbi:lysozyme-like [Argiope bruennichi]|uniref:lysozyme n=1 Tax=Argiope bruennichi TaxID=94029 RepID=A0A8T0EF39_ARGBR|nr:lysozyme-like [Argiope bruennichi]KAF8770595.1 Lysozyme 1 like protein [Argiope bruennichi]
MDYRTVVFLLSLTGFIAFIRGQSHGVGQIMDDCLSCMCEASSECDDEIECHGRGEKYCGPYLISYLYWKDGGAHGDDFEKCVSYRPCAEASIRGYMRKWASDCNGDNRVDCYDFARIHKTGGPSCNSSWVLNTDYWMRFEACYSQML